MRSTKKTGLLQLELVELLLAVHLDDERNGEDEEGGSGDPRGLSGTPQELLGDEGGVAGSSLALEDDRRLGDRCGNPRQYAVASASIVRPLRERDSAFSRRHCPCARQRERLKSVSIEGRSRVYERRLVLFKPEMN